ncbi:MAG: hypothetical protein U0Z75_02185 [Deinococcaceae bacterium]
MRDDTQMSQFVATGISGMVLELEVPHGIDVLGNPNFIGVVCSKMSTILSSTQTMYSPNRFGTAIALGRHTV